MGTDAERRRILLRPESELGFLHTLIKRLTEIVLVSCLKVYGSILAVFTCIFFFLLFA